MKKLLLVGFAVCLAASAAYADYTVSYGWEDGTGTILGYYGNVVDDTNVTGPQSGQAGGAGSYDCPGAHTGDRYLHVAEEPHSGTPQAYIACITGIGIGEQVTASFWGYDITPGASPSLRIWAHWVDATSCPDCIDAEYCLSASGLYDYTAGTGWDFIEFTWVRPDTVECSALVIEARLYSTPSSGAYRTDFWVDDVSVTAPDNAHVLLPDLTGPSALENTYWGGIKALYR
jgi:hypothetical protein